MHRFRKKSDVKRSQVPIALHAQAQSFQSGESLPELPSPGDFRTSLILPDLSRRFSLLRSPSGDPVTIDDLRYKFAEQRARGAENQISEAEEDMLLETLGRLRSRGVSTPERSQESISERDEPSGSRHSARSGAGSGSFSTSVNSSPSSRSTKRHSNNLFGSGRLRDYTYMKSISSTRGTAESARTLSLTPTESSLAAKVNVAPMSNGLRPVTPEGSSEPSSVQSSPNEKSSLHSTSLTPPSPYGEQSLTAAEYRLAKTLGPSNLKRASMALEEVIKEIEDEVEDEIVMPRQVPVPRGSFDLLSYPVEVRNSDAPSNTSSIIEAAGMAMSSDRQVQIDAEQHRASPVSSRTLPGYVPGMPRPMTPRDFDADEVRSHSTTPRATSTGHSSFSMDASNSPGLGSISSGAVRRESVSSAARQSPRPTTPLSSSPMFLQRSPNGRYTPEDIQHQRGDSIEFDNPLNSSLLSRRRPASPLAGPPFQPMTVSSSSRPSTPSNIIWNPSASTDGGNSSNNRGLYMGSAHSRDNSWTSDGGISSSDIHGSINRHATHSPALPDSPTFDRHTGQPNTLSAASNQSTSNARTQLSIPPIANLDVETTVTSGRPPQSPTPTQSAPRSPVSPAYSVSNYDNSRNGSRRSSKQNAPSSPFNLGSFPALVFSPMANSSRSSLESAGSSFHSSDAGKDHFAGLFGDGESQPIWHEFPETGSSSVTPGGSPDDEWDTEDIVKRYAGLKKTDFVAIQEKLVSVAIAKAASPDSRERAPSSLRRRRPSTSQSNYSSAGRIDRIASPPPASQPPGSPTTANTNGVVPDQYSQLLNSVVDSIQMTRENPAPLDTAGLVPAPPSKASPKTRKNRELAHVLFGIDDEERDHERDGKTPKPEQQTVTLADDNEESPARVENSSHQLNLPEPPQEPPASSSHSASSPYLLHPNPSQPRIPQTPQEEAALTREVQRKAEAAMMVLNKGPSHVTARTDTLSHSPSVTRRIKTNQISEPVLVSASTSVDTIPLRSPSLTANNNTGSKIGSRFKKLRGSLRAKNVTPTEDSSTYPASMKSVSPNQTVNYDPAKLGGPSVLSASEIPRSKAPVPSPPASAGPGLKGFMARFRNKPRMSEVPAESEQRYQKPSLTAAPQPPVTQPWSQPLVATSSSLLQPVTPPVESQQPASSISSLPASPPTTQESKESTVIPDVNDSMKQLFEAATDLGLDKDALKDLLARSGSISSRSTDWTFVTRSNSTVTTPKPGARDLSFGATSSGNNSFSNQGNIATQNVTEQAQDDSLSAPHEQGQPGGSDTPASTEPTRRIASTRRPGEPFRRPREGLSDNATSAVVRRTIIYPSDTKAAGVDLNALMRKNSSRRKRTSATSVSSRSIHDRAPTPPPPKSSGAKRFSNDGFPPVPHLPHSFGQSDNLLNPASSVTGPIEKSSSAYDSLYDMYAGESRVGSSVGIDGNVSANTQPPDGRFTSTSESGPALEVIELANGETIWSIVNGLRDDDEESIYTGRASFASEYSTREPNGDGMQIFVKEHGRSGSKGSSSSFLSRKKSSQGKARPETKVFYGTSAQIGRLIENLSQGMDAGSFNILPSPTRVAAPGHSASSSISTNDVNWTVEERLEHMLGSMGSS